MLRHKLEAVGSLHSHSLCLRVEKRDDTKNCYVGVCGNVCSSNFSVDR